MSSADIFQEVRADYLEILKKSDEKQKKVDKIIGKSKIFPVTLYTSYVSSRKNNWLFFWKAKSKKNVGDVSVITGVCYYNTPEGRYAILPTTIQGRLAMIVYPPHFFERYKLRVGIELTGTDLITRFFELNASYGFMSENETNLGITITHVYGTCKEGVCMGIQSQNYNIVLFKTFVTYEMLKGQQIEDFAKTEQIRKEIHEKVTTL